MKALFRDNQGFRKRNLSYPGKAYSDHHYQVDFLVSREGALYLKEFHLLPFVMELGLVYSVNHIGPVDRERR